MVVNLRKSVALERALPLESVRVVLVTALDFARTLLGELLHFFALFALSLKIVVFKSCVRFPSLFQSVEKHELAVVKPGSQQNYQPSVLLTEGLQENAVHVAELG